MSRALDKFLYTTTYKQEFCIGQSQPRAVGRVAEVRDCKARFVPGIALGIGSDVQNPSQSCKCQAGGLMPQRGAVASGLPTNLDLKCTCFTCGECQKQPKKTTGKEILPRKVANAIGPGPCQAPPQRVRHGQRKRIKKKSAVEPDFEAPPRNPAEPRPNIIPWARERKDERREPDVLRLRRNTPQGEVRDVIHGEGARGLRGQRSYEPTRRRASLSGTEVRIPGPFWNRARPDERREVDVLRKRKFDRRLSDVSDVIHGGGGMYGGDERLVQGRYRKRPGPSRTHLPGQFWMHKRPDERREIDALRKRKFEKYSEIKEVIHGDGTGNGGRPSLNRRHSLDLPRLCRPRSSSRIPGPFWMRDRADARREPDIDRKKRFGTPQSEVRDVIHGEEERARARMNAREVALHQPHQGHVNVYDLPPGPSHADPFWFKERPDERREPDMDRKKKFGKERIEAAEVIHGEDFRDQWYPSFKPVPEDEAFSDYPGGDEDLDEDEDESEPYKYERACKCAPEPIGRGWDSWTPDENPAIPDDLDPVIREVPEARLSCAPAAETSKYEQPNTFMRKLYEKYPYLYQVLKETPPDELVSKVFKDRFLSTYQVDYLHMGIGREQYPKGGAEREEIYTGPDGEREPQMIPGCSYRYGKKGDFGRKKTVYEKKEKEEEVVQDVKEEPRISEYMATISKLGGEIISDQLYKVSQITKTMKNQYSNM